MRELAAALAASAAAQAETQQCQQRLQIVEEDMPGIWKLLSQFQSNMPNFSFTPSVPQVPMQLLQLHTTTELDDSSDSEDD